VFVVNEEIERLMGDGVSTVEIQAAAVRGGMRLIRTSVLDAVRDGRTTLAEVARVLGGHRRVERSNEGGVLLVEDDAVTRKVARRLLEREGLTVTEAADGQEALDLLAQNSSFSLIVTDLEMPRMDGRALLAELRRRPGTAAVPVIVLTASDDPETETQLMQDGADDYISKPIQAPVFIARVKGGLRRQTLA
jgi:CheY-like chemotaxis protein